MFTSFDFGYTGQQLPITNLMSTQPAPGDFTRGDVLNMLEAARGEVGRRYTDTPYLRVFLQSQYLEGAGECSLQKNDPMQVLHEQMRGERRTLDAYNKHRLGKAAHRYYKNVPETDDVENYDEADNIPEALEWFPLRNEVAKRGFQILAPPIYQVPSTVAPSQELTAMPTADVNPAVEVKPSPKKASKKKTGFAAANYDKLANAPSAQLDFPDGNITLAEITAFLPQSIKSWDVIDRLLFNGAMSVTLAAMINHFRDMPNGPIPNNSVYRMMKGSMDKRDDTTYKNWSVTAHQNLKKPNGFDPASVSVAGFRTPINYNKREAAAAVQGHAPTILFRDLKKGVKTMPSGFDSLDLTRCVQYCLDHPDEDWYYPQDFVELVSRLPQDPHLAGYPLGPAPVQPAHQDAFIVGKYTSNQKLQTAKQVFKRRRDSHGRLLQEKTNSDEENKAMDTDTGNDSEDDLPSESRMSNRKKLSRGTSHRSSLPAFRQRNHSFTSDIDSYSDINSESDGDEYQGPKRRKKTTMPPRTSGRTQQFGGSYTLDSDSDSYTYGRPARETGTVPPSVLRPMGRKVAESDVESTDGDTSEDGSEKDEDDGFEGNSI